ncbi:MAG: folylpolyglutamate synthase/dihydrofolate synthase family protein [Verrucomicrobiota bacterium]|nr:folylpolyglutamate synthase/dihydrofolate synthase family protein [Verrucomicrobiota bacterium]
MFQSYQQTIQFLFQLRQFGTKLGLENIIRLNELLDCPAGRLKFIHIAGTNGKGSVAAMLEAILRESGYHTGLFTSPHLVSFAERFQIDRGYATQEQIVQLANRVMVAAKSLEKENGGRFPTFFEFITAMALEHFAREKVDFVLWETGMGGRLDATNLVNPMVSVITSIGFDHMAYLGGTLELIAAEKAGIIKLGVPCVIGPMSIEAKTVIIEKCRDEMSPLYEAGNYKTDYDLGLAGDFQQVNAQIALKTIDCLKVKGVRVPDGKIIQGLKNVQWPGRMSILREDPPLIIDGCHNLPAAQTLASALNKMYNGQKWTICFGVLKDKQWKAILDELIPLAKKFLILPVQSGRTESPEIIVDYLNNKSETIKVEQIASVGECLEKTASEPVIICGSLFLAGEALWKLGVLPHKDNLELNEKL